MLGGCGLDASPVVGCCEHGNETSVSINGIFLN
jgi:hypothetical protein